MNAQKVFQFQTCHSDGSSGCITRVMSHLLSGMNHQVKIWWIFRVNLALPCLNHPSPGTPNTSHCSAWPIPCYWRLALYDRWTSKILWDFNGFQWISMDFNGFQWISMDFNGFQWISMDFMWYSRCAARFSELQWDGLVAFEPGGSLCGLPHGAEGTRGIITSRFAQTWLRKSSINV